MRHVLKEGPPEWAEAPTLAVGPEFPADDATLIPETWARGARLRITGVREDDAAWESDEVTRLLSDVDVGAICRALGSGQDAVREESAWGRVYRSLWSLDPPSEQFERGTFLWFYPMSEARLTLRVRAEPLAAALPRAFDWWDTQPLPAATRRELSHARAALGRR